MIQFVCQNLTIGYEGKPLLEHLSFSVNKGDYLCIVGENGAGKTTFLKTLLGLLPPLKGNIQWTQSSQQQKIGYLPQQTELQRDFPASVWEIVLSGCQRSHWWQPFYSAQDKEKAEQAIKQMNIVPLKHRCYRELSGGQQQRVLLARALCSASDLLILDEPVSGLDPKATGEMYEMIRQLNQQGITIIMISHDMGAVIEDATMVLHLGKNIFFGSKEEYLKTDIARYFALRHEEKER